MITLWNASDVHVYRLEDFQILYKVKGNLITLKI